MLKRKTPLKSKSKLKARTGFKKPNMVIGSNGKFIFSSLPHTTINKDGSLTTNSKKVAALLASGNGMVMKASSLAAPKKKMRARSKTNEGWLKWAMKEVWSKRPHACEVCRVPIAFATPANFSHLLPRGSYRKYKLDTRNVRIQCAECHHEWHDRGPAALFHEDRWWRTVTLYRELCDEANGVDK